MFSSRRRLTTLGGISAVLLLALIVACGGQTPSVGSLEGEVVVGSSPFGTEINRGPDGQARPLTLAGRAEASASSGHDSLEFIAGELIVGFKQVATVSAASALESAATLEAAGETLLRARMIPAIAAGLYRAPGLDHASTLALAAELAALPEIAFAEPNRILHPTLVPNDTFYDLQWHYQAISMEDAWDITTGSSSVVVGVLDSGIYWSQSDANLRHPDFAGRIVPGYDFISDPDIAMDGDGRDSDPFDSAGGTYHGTHVAGTIGAASDNDEGVTGIDWSAKVLPVRVLGDGGGSLADILDALIWAAGSSVTGVPSNANPADVINMSLGGAFACSPALQATLDFVSVDTIVVVAAGNENLNASDFSPAGCAGVITVGATDYLGERTQYSNYGSRIDVMAPGGALYEDLDGDLFPDGVLSTWYDDDEQQSDYRFLQGTSMAAPHVAGVVALMKALEPGLGTAEALAALRASATPLSDASCDNWGASRTLTSIDCGAGLIDAAVALTAVDSGVIPDPPGAKLRFTPTALEFGSSTDRIDFQVTNISGSTLDWGLYEYQTAGDNPGTMGPNAFTIPAGSPQDGTLDPGASVMTAIVIDREQLSHDGNYQIQLIFEIDGGDDEEFLLMRFSKTTSITPTISGPMIVAAYIEDAFGQLVTSGSQTSLGAIVDFDIEVLPGENMLVAWSDENENDLVDEGDLFGVYPTLLSVAAGGRISGLTLYVDPVYATSPEDHGWLAEQLERAAAGDR